MPRTRDLCRAAALSAALAAIAVASACAGSEPRGWEKDRPTMADRSSPQTVPQTPAPNGSLSEQLDRTNGVIRPPAKVDPEAVQPTPETGPQSTPVIPPPGTPGSAKPKVEPK